LYTALQNEQARFGGSLSLPVPGSREIATRAAKYDAACRHDIFRLVRSQFTGCREPETL
jgi:hypothetical protein